jgi:exodeoxyribonuclease VII large subunit
MTEHIFTVSELSEYIKSIVSNKKVKVSGEVSQPKISGGHLYFSLKDANSNIKSIIWKSKNIDKTKIEQGQKVTLDCKLDYYNNGGTVNLLVDKIIIEEDMGSLFKRYDDIKEEFIKKGYFDKEHKLLLPKIIKNIHIITSENGAALQDFLYTLGNNNCNINYTISDVMVQGVDCPKNICSVLANNMFDNIDLIIITRGGGSFEDLFGFSQPELIESVYNFRFDIPILSAIGHMVDNPLLDLVADVSTPTPSLAAQFIIDHNKKYIDKLHNIKINVRDKLLENININKNILSRFNDTLYRQFINFKNSCKEAIKDRINKQLLELKCYESRLNILQCNDFKNNIVLFKNNIKVNNPIELIKGNEYILRWGDNEYNINII